MRKRSFISGEELLDSVQANERTDGRDERETELTKREACEECSGTGVAYIGEDASASLCPACHGYGSVESVDRSQPVIKVVTLKGGGTITVSWCKALGCYVTIPESER
jgi:DnaJ-class molecular chaperone